MSEKPKDKEIRLEVAAKFVRILAPPQTWFFLSHVELIGHIFVILFEMVTQSWRLTTPFSWPEASGVFVEKSPPATSTIIHQTYFQFISSNFSLISCLGILCFSSSFFLICFLVFLSYYHLFISFFSEKVVWTRAHTTSSRLTTR